MNENDQGWFLLRIYVFGDNKGVTRFWDDAKKETSKLKEEAHIDFDCTLHDKMYSPFKEWMEPKIQAMMDQLKSEFEKEFNETNP